MQSEYISEAKVVRAQDGGSGSSGPAERTVRGVDDIPLAADFLSLGHSSHSVYLLK